MKRGIVTLVPFAAFFAVIFAALGLACTGPETPVAATEQALDGTLFHARACAVRAAYEAADLGAFEILDDAAVPAAVPTGAAIYARFDVPNVGRAILAESTMLVFYTERGEPLARAAPSVPLTWQSTTGDELRCSDEPFPSTGPTPLPGCAAAGACSVAAAIDLGYISGDTGEDTRTVTGSSSAWLKIEVNEDSNGIFSDSYPVRLRATLTSPPGSNFDLFLHDDECTSPTSRSEKPAGQVDVASVSRPEHLGVNDSHYVLLEVRRIGTENCDPNAKWTLKLEGNK